jgi:NADH:ubiquinone oxidoreductase subunit E
MENIEVIIQKHQGRPSALIPILLDIQHECRYHPEDALVLVSQKLSVPLSQIYSLATFYKAFSLKPRGKHSISVCLGTACHVQGSTLIIEKVERDLDVKRGDTTKDLNFDVEEVHCVGCCGLAPVMTVDRDLYGKVTLTKVNSILKKYIGSTAKQANQKQTQEAA